MPCACSARGTATVHELAYDSTKYVVNGCRRSHVVLTIPLRPPHWGRRLASEPSYEARFRIRRFLTGKRARRRAGGIATTGTAVVRMTPSVVDPNNSLDVRPAPR